MAGIYVHIPFCLQLCHYCDFHKSISLANKSDLLWAISKELELRSDYLKNEAVSTVYLGGGTPSVLTEDELKRTVETIRSSFQVSETAEWTIEANPEDLDKNYLGGLVSLGFNRLSIGVQSVHDAELKLMNRRHNADQGLRVLALARKAGFKNISIDLIYGIPGSDKRSWKKTLSRIVQQDIDHISAYHLTIENGTRFGKWRKNGKIEPVDEAESIEQFTTMKQAFQKAGFIHYEISSFAKEGFFSLHNSSYWDQTAYLGIGPSAHSYNKETRQWNVSNNRQYISSIIKNELPFEKEILSTTEKYKEFLITRLRTMWGIELDEVSAQFGDQYREDLESKYTPLVENGNMEVRDGKLRISEKALFISDHLISGLFPED